MSKSLDNSVAFVDVVTNGLGGMLVLFFIAVVVQTSLEWQDEQRQRSESEKDELPYVVLVRSPVDGKCFDPESEVWSCEGMAEGMIDGRRGVNVDWGPRHALLVVTSPLNATRQRLHVRTRPDHRSSLLVEIYPAGAAPQVYSVPVGDEELTEVWPRVSPSMGESP